MNTTAFKRTSNFSLSEEKVLLRIVEKYKDIVECKKTDSVMNSKKNSIWAVITKEYNSNATTSRTVIALQTKYKNIKKRSKLKFTVESNREIATGDGPAAKRDSVDKRVLDLLEERMTAGQNDSEFDDEDYEDEENLNNALSDWVHSKCETKTVDSKMKIEKHRLEMLFMREEHAFKQEEYAFKREEHAFKREEHAFRKEEHALKIEILKQTLLNLKK